MEAATRKALKNILRSTEYHQDNLRGGLMQVSITHTYKESRCIGSKRTRLYVLRLYKKNRRQWNSGRIIQSIQSARVIKKLVWRYKCKQQ